MKKSLTENSFRSIDDMSPDELKSYLDENGYWDFYDKIFIEGIEKEGEGVTWIRKHPHEFEYNILTHEDLIKLQLSTWLQRMREEGAPGMKNNPNSVEAYNAFARCDEWRGGYVEGYGYIDVAASSLYGNSLCLGNSWYACGAPQNPIRVAKFYKLSLANRWRGGDVSSWGYVSENTKILGCSTETLTQVGQGEVTLGTLINVNHSLGHGVVTIESMKNRFKDFWDTARNSYQIDDGTLSEYIRQNFYYAQTNDIKEGLAQHKTSLLRQVTRTTDDYQGIKKYGYDVMVVDYNGIKHKYECIEPTGPSVTSISEKDIREGKIEIQTHILSKS